MPSRIRVPLGTSQPVWSAYSGYSWVPQTGTRCSSAVLEGTAKGHGLPFGGTQGYTKRRVSPTRGNRFARQSTAPDYRTAMAGTDRAFRALVHHDPAALGGMLQALLPDEIDPDATLEMDDLEPSRLDALAPAIDADWLGQVKHRDGKRKCMHLEAQGYGDKTFLDRAFDYHLISTIRNKERLVCTVLFWLIKPSALQRTDLIVRGDLTLRVRSFVLPELDANLFLADDNTACFAAGCDRGAMTDEDLCGRVADALVRTQASWYRRHMAVVCAMTQGRYRVMVDAMEQRNLEPVIIEDLVKYGHDLGEAKGKIEGKLEGKAEGLLPLIRLFERKIKQPLSSEARKTLQARLTTLGPDRLGDVALDLDGPALQAWLDDPQAS